MVKESGRWAAKAIDAYFEREPFLDAASAAFLRFRLRHVYHICYTRIYWKLIRNTYPARYTVAGPLARRFSSPRT